MANNEDYLDALTAYSRNTSREIPPILEQYLNGVAKNGETLFQWSLLKPLIVGKMEQVIGELRQGLGSENIPQRPNVENVRFDVMQARIMDALHKFNGAPFTIQRLCELLVDPKRHYKRSDKFMRGLEKNVLVVSTVDPYGRKVVSESGGKHLVNGMDTNGSPFFPRDSNISSNLPPVPGWVTTTVTMATHAQNTPAVDSLEQKPAQQHTPQDSPVTTSGASLSLVSSIYADQGEQLPAVHAEEVVEETVVTMDTSEAGSVAVDGGEAMAEDAEEEEMGGDDTNASSSSSSSTSSEELSASDTGGSPGVATERTTAVSSTSETQTRPWASIASEGENKRDTQASSSGDSYSSNAADSADKPEQLSELLELSPNKQLDQPSSSETNTDHAEPADGGDVVDSIEESSSESLPGTPSESDKALSSSFGFAASASVENMTAPKDLSQESESDDTSSMTSSDTGSENSATGSDDFIPSSTATNTAVASPSLPHSHESSLSNTGSYTEVVASSSTDSQSTNISDDTTTEECDSVAGHERLVDSVEPSPSQNVQVSLFSSHSPKSSCSPPIEVSKNSEQSDSSILSSSLDSDEPQAKQCRILEEASSPRSCSTVADTDVFPSKEEEAASSNRSDMIADTTTDSTIKTSASLAWDKPSEVQESHDTVSCSTGDLDIAVPAVEPEDEDCAQEKVTFPASQNSSGDSLGFDVFGGLATEENVEEKQTEELVKEETKQQESEVKTVLPEAENDHEPMDQE